MAIAAKDDIGRRRLAIVGYVNSESYRTAAGQLVLARCSFARCSVDRTACSQAQHDQTATIANIDRDLAMLTGSVAATRIATANAVGLGEEDRLAKAEKSEIDLKTVG